MLLFSTVITGGSTVSSGVQPPMNASGMAASNAIWLNGQKHATYCCEFTENQEIHALRSLKFKKKETAPDGIPFMCGLFCFKLS